MKRLSCHSVRYTSRHFRITTSGVREGDIDAKVLGARSLRLTTPAGEREVCVPEAPQDSVGFQSSLPILNFAYSLAMHELHANRDENGLLKAGAAWSSAWTRDIAYAAALGADLAAPEACRRTLMSRVKNGIILQDTGTGGGWPISTDRVSWALGAWACYLSGGDRDWLEFCITALRNTLEQDDAVLRFNPLVPGETSFLDWREQSYPVGMSPSQIGESYALSTNVLHYLCRKLLARMLTEVGRPEEARTYSAAADELGRTINTRFRRPNSSKYAMYLTPDGRQDSHTDALGTALVALSGLAGKDGSRVLHMLPRTEYGTPVFTPFNPEVREAYHNFAIWPFVEAFVLLAQADQQNMEGVEFSAAVMLRAALLNATNKENFHACTGRANDTLSNSDAQLWSAAGMLGLFYHALLGLQFEHDSIVFRPCIPTMLEGDHWFTGLRIRNMVLDVHINGYGSEVASVFINGQPASPSIALGTEGRLQVELQLIPSIEKPVGRRNRAPLIADQGLASPVWCDDSTPTCLRWKPVPGATRYVVSYNGKTARRTTKTCFYTTVASRMHYRQYRVQALGSGKSSALGLPMEYIARGAFFTTQPHTIGDGSESYMVENAQAWLDTRPCTSITTYHRLTLPAGTYGVRVCYCNATASLRDSDTCALRELWMDGKPLGVLVMPHNTEINRWDDYTLSAMLECSISAGEHEFSLCYTPRCSNMHGGVNQCMVRRLEIIRLH